MANPIRCAGRSSSRALGFISPGSMFPSSSSSSSAVGFQVAKRCRRALHTSNGASVLLAPRSVTWRLSPASCPSASSTPPDNQRLNHRRHASSRSNTSPVSRPSSPSSSSGSSDSKTATAANDGPIAERTTQNARLNAPSTLPPLLISPTRQAGQSAPAYWYKLGKAYFAFYKAGMKAVWNNSMTARSLRASKQIGSSAEGAGAALDEGRLSRAQWQLLRRAQVDGRRLPIFGLVLLVCGEFTVLLLPVVGGLVPRTCWIPAQEAHMRGKAERRRAASFKRADALTDVGQLQMEKGSEGGLTAESMSPAQLVHVGRSLGLYSAWWDRLWDRLPTAMLRKRVQAWERYVRRDDAALVRDGGVAQLDTEELRMAAEERGIDVLGRPEGVLRKAMEAWLRERKRQSLYNLVLTRPSVWDRKAGSKAN